MLEEHRLRLLSTTAIIEPPTLENIKPLGARRIEMPDSSGRPHWDDHNAAQTTGEHMLGS